MVSSVPPHPARRQHGLSPQFPPILHVASMVSSVLAGGHPPLHDSFVQDGVAEAVAARRACALEVWPPCHALEVWPPCHALEVWSPGTLQPRPHAARRSFGP